MRRTSVLTTARLGPLLLVATAVACGGRNPSDQRLQQRRRVASWEATGRMLREQQAAGDVPRVYAAPMGRLIAEEVQRAGAKLAPDSADAAP